MTSPASSPLSIVNTNPATGEVISEHSCATPAEVHDAALRARAAQPAWNALGIPQRVRIIRRFQELLLRDRAQLAARITAESGKPLVESMLSEITVTLDAAKFVCENAYRVLHGEDVQHSNPIMRTKRGQIVYEPIGVLGVIAPWNYPMSILSSDILGALVLGNAVVLKPSELTPITALEFARLLHEAGVPIDVMQVVLGYGDVGVALIESAIDKLVFTGSVPTGKRVAEACAKRLLPVVLELGGKDPMIVLDDADLDVASSAALWGALMNAGQTCLSVERCYVQRGAYDRFIEHVTRKIRELKVGNGADSSTDIGPLISERQLETVETQVNDAVAHGARVLFGGKRLPEIGANFYAPTLIVDVAPNMRLMREETFGPVLPVIPFDTDTDAIRLANASEFGLAASIFTGDRARGERVARSLDCGTVMINDVIAAFAIPEAPHGGTKSSGIGRTHGLWGMREFVRPKYIATEMLPKVKKVWWYKYGDAVTRQMDAFAEMLFGSNVTARAAGARGSAASLWRKRH